MEIPSRSQQKPSDCWDLSSLYIDDASWEAAFSSFQNYPSKIEAYRDRLASGQEILLEFLMLLYEVSRLDDRLGHYAFLRHSEDGGDAANQARQMRFSSAASLVQTAASWFTPELLQLDADYLQTFMQSPAGNDYRIALEKTLRFGPHTLSDKEEQLLALQEDASQTAQRSFAALTDVDLDFGSIETAQGAKALSQSSYAWFMLQADRGLRQRAWEQFYAGFDKHKNTLANLYAGAIKIDIFNARARKYPSSVEAALFGDKVPLSVYQSLVTTVREFLPHLHRYYQLRAKKLGLEKLELYDTRISLVSDVKTRYSYAQAVEVIIKALHPLGQEYLDVLQKGLSGAWVDRYENKGKRSGAFSAGSFDGEPYILMNYKDTVIGDVFTLAHEAGHSMHSWYSRANNPYPHYRYSIFEAEVASTFNEELLFDHLLKTSQDKDLKGYLLNKHLDDIIGTVFRQTMFAEFELICHSKLEAGEALGLAELRAEYRKLLQDYFGPAVNIHPLADLEGLRIPHFYRAFYVYKYATGLSAAMALAQGVLKKGGAATQSYLQFLKSGGRSYPIENLDQAGVDMSQPQAIRNAMQVFVTVLDQVETF